MANRKILTAAAVAVVGMFAASGAANATHAPKHHHHHHKHHHHAHHHHHHHYVAPKPKVLVFAGKPCKCGEYRYYSKKYKGCLDARLK